MRRFQVTQATKILDVGGDTFNWNLIDIQPQLTILNVFPPPNPLPSHVKWLIGDGCQLPFGDMAFDVVFSNSVIEHLGTITRQQRFANEIRRVAPSCFVQTPNYGFPIEPHLIAPFIHQLPRSWQRPLYPLTGWGLLYRPTKAQMDAQFAELRLLKRRDMEVLFPDCRIVVERVAGLGKSLIAVRRQDGKPVEGPT